MLFEVQITVRPCRESTLLALSRAVAVNCAVVFCVSDRPGGEIDTLDTGTGVTCAVIVLLAPSHVAVMFPEPNVLPVTRPVALTEATSGLLAFHVTVRPVSTCCEALRHSAPSCFDWPSRMI